MNYFHILILIGLLLSGSIEIVDDNILNHSITHNDITIRSVSDSSLDYQIESRRVPAEWESHAATWMQWPGWYESAMCPAFADIIDVIQDYEPVNILVTSSIHELVAKIQLIIFEVPLYNITWHIIPIDNSWMRDNGPIYVTDDASIWIQNWKFDAWGGNFGPRIKFENDDLVPDRVAEYLGMVVEDYQDYVLEKGNLEFNGAGTLVLNWDCQDDRNPGLSEFDHEMILKNAFGVNQIIWAYGHHRSDGTTGHIDGTARFIDHDTIVVADYYHSETEKNLAISCEESGLEVLRYQGDPNWLVGNGFVAAMSEGIFVDNALKSQIESFFPNRDVYIIDARSITNAGGGIHCVTNDQPSFNN